VCDDDTATITIPSAAARDLVARTPGLSPIDPAGGGATLPWTDLVLVFDVASGHASWSLGGTVVTPFGTFLFEQVMQTTPGPWVYTHVSASVQEREGTIGGVAYNALSGVPVDDFCSQGAACAFVEPHAYDPGAGVVNLTGPTTLFVGDTTFAVPIREIFSGLGDMVLYEVPEPGSAWLLLFALGAIASAKR
jgi:hypothetical protein